MFEQTVELPAVERAPWAVEVVSGLRLLPGVVVVLELEVDRGAQLRSDATAVKTGTCGHDASERSVNRPGDRLPGAPQLGLTW